MLTRCRVKIIMFVSIKLVGGLNYENNGGIDYRVYGGDYSGMG